MSLLVGTVTNIILPIFGYNQLLKIGPSLSLINFAGFTSYAIVAKQLFDIKVILTSLFATIIAILLLFNALSSITNFEYAWKGSLFIIFLIFGYLLIKSVSKEVKQREKMEEMAKELAIANIKLKKLDQTKSEFLSIASHQLRTPLSAIKGYLSMVLEGTYGKISKKVEKPINNVFQASKQLNQLVNTLLNVSRIEAGRIKLEPIPTPIKEVLEPIVEEFKIVAQEKGLYLKLSFADSLPLIPLDKEKINQVIMNIIDNAIKYTEKGGIIIKCKMKNEKLKITIADTGLGMSKEQLGEIFQKFNRGTAGETHWASGAGLGLYIAKEFTELHNGKIWAESGGEGKGSTFNIELPVISGKMVK
ncbi:HAMP domain-containing histidine kinase [Patescibacteria group bacterium]|nr:HAMP domain-containing histidine kinase [Patescibacteria group bacterium]